MGWFLVDNAAIAAIIGVIIGAFIENRMKFFGKLHAYLHSIDDAKVKHDQLTPIIWKGYLYNTKAMPEVVSSPEIYFKINKKHIKIDGCIIKIADEKVCNRSKSYSSVIPPQSLISFEIVWYKNDDEMQKLVYDKLMLHYENVKDKSQEIAIKVKV